MNIGRDIKIEEKDGYLFISPQGEMTISSANVLSKNILGEIGSKPSLPVVLDLHKVDHINSPAVAVVAKIVKLYKSNNLDVILLRPKKIVLEVLEISGLLEVVKVYTKKSELPVLSKKS